MTRSGRQRGYIQQPGRPLLTGVIVHDRGSLIGLHHDHVIDDRFDHTERLQRLLQRQLSCSGGNDSHAGGCQAGEGFLLGRAAAAALCCAHREPGFRHLGPPDRRSSAAGERTAAAHSSCAGAPRCEDEQRAASAGWLAGSGGRRIGRARARGADLVPPPPSSSSAMSNTGIRHRGRVVAGVVTARGSARLKCEAARSGGNARSGQLKHAPRLGQAAQPLGRACNMRHHRRQAVLHRPHIAVVPSSHDRRRLLLFAAAVLFRVAAIAARPGRGAARGSGHGS
eukprot:COSAG02_NODE_7794_length_2843_cov_1.120262_2_plen_282_part_00